MVRGGNLIVHGGELKFYETGETAPSYGMVPPPIPPCWAAMGNGRVDVGVGGCNDKKGEIFHISKILSK